MDTKKKNRIPLFISIGGYSITPPPVSNSFTSLEGILNMVVDLLGIAMGFAAVLAVVMLVYAGVLFITSSGNPDSITKAQKGLVAAIVGLIIVFLTRMILLYILNNFLN